MSVSITSIAESIRGWLPNAPDFLIERCIVSALQKFCVETWCLKESHYFTFSDKDVTTYDFPDFTNKEIISVQSYQIDADSDLIPINNSYYNDGNVAVDFLNRQVKFTDSFVESNDGCYIYFILRYGDSITEIDDLLYINYRDGIIGGTVTELSLKYGISPAKEINYFLNDYNNAVAKAKMQANNAYFTKDMQVNQRIFV